MSPLQLSEAQEGVSSLQADVTSLTEQLREALEKQASLSQELLGTQEAMELYQTTAKQVCVMRSHRCLHSLCVC